MTPSVPPLLDLREHHVFALNLLNVYLLLLEGDMLPGYQTPSFLKRISVRLLLNKMEMVKAGDMPQLSGEETKTLYAACFICNKLLGSSRSEYISGMILQQMPAGHQLKDYSHFRTAMYRHNTALLSHTEQQAPGIPDFADWKTQLDAYQPELP
jgi:hypothetical protein